MTGWFCRHVLPMAIVVFVATGAVSAQAPAGTGQPATDPSQQEAAEEPPTPPDEDLGTPKPAGVGSAQAPVTSEAAADQDVDPAVASSTAPAAPSRPFSGLFGGAAPSGDSRGHTLGLSASVFAAHLKGEAIDDPNTQADILADGTFDYGGGSAALDYGYAWRHANVGTFGNVSTAYIPEYDNEDRDPWVNRWSVGANAGFNKELSRKLRAAGAAAVDYSPYYQQDLLSQASVPTLGSPLGTPGLDFVLGRNPSVNTQLNGSLGYTISRRGSLEGYYTLSRRDFTSDDTSSALFTDYYDQIVGGRYVHRLNRWVGARAGYGYRTARLGLQNDRTFHSHELDVGVDGGRSFALSRRTTFSFNTGSSVFVTQGTDAEVAPARTRWFLTGAADLVHAWARSWSANVGTSRSVNYEAGFDRPLLSNQVYAGFGGLLTRRVDVRLTGSYVSGSVGFSTGGNGFDTSSATGSIRWAIARNLAAYGQYFYYHYSFDSGVVLPVFLQHGLDRQGISVGLTTWFPLIAPRGRR